MRIARFETIGNFLLAWTVRDRSQCLRRVENGLLTANAIRGRPVKGLSLADLTLRRAAPQRSTLRRGGILGHMTGVAHSNQRGSDRR